MYLSLQSLLGQGPSVTELFTAALTSSQVVRDVLSDVAPDDPLLQRLFLMRTAPAILVDLWRVDTHLTADEVGKIVLAVRDHWNRNGFSFARCDDPHRWARAAYECHQPLLHWRTLSPQAGWNLFGAQLRATQLDVFRLVVDFGTVTVEQVATNGTIFSQRPPLSDWRVQRDIALGRKPQSPAEFNRSEARRVLSQLRQLQLVVGRGDAYSIVRPVRENLS